MFLAPKCKNLSVSIKLFPGGSRFLAGYRLFKADTNRVTKTTFRTNANVVEFFMQKQGEPVSPCFVSFVQQMRKPLAISLLTLFVFSSLVPVKVQEAVKALPDLLEHYAEHLEENPDLTIIEFWELHYGSEYNQHQKDHDHSKLPGKNHSCCHVHSMVLAAIGQSSYGPHIPLNSAGDIHLVDEEALPSPHVHNIWQPPKSC